MEKLYISPSILNEILARYCKLGCRFFSLSSLYIAIPFWSAEFLLKNQPIALWEFPCMLFVDFSLAAFRILSLSFTFAILIMICVGVGLFEFILFGILCDSYTCVSISFFRFKNFFSHNFIKYIFYPFLSCCF